MATPSTKNQYQIQQDSHDDTAQADRVLQVNATGAAVPPPAVGQAAMAASSPVVIASDQTAVPVTPAGNVASGATDSGNPVKVAGRYNASRPTFTDGQRADFQQDPKGNLAVTLFQASTSTAIAGANTSADGVATSSGTEHLEAVARNSEFNGTTWDRRRNNQDTAALITAAAATISQTGADQTNHNANSLKVVLDMTTVGTGSVTLTIQGKDAASGKYYTLLAGAAVVTNSTNVYEIGPGLPATANVSANTLLPRVWRVITTANNANATSYTVGASVVN